VSTPTSLDLPAGVRRTTVSCERGTFAEHRGIGGFFQELHEKINIHGTFHHTGAHLRQ